MSPHFLSLFSFNKKTIPFDLEKTVGHYLLSLPRCTNNILVISRSYGDKRYNYEMTVTAANLTSWALKQDKGVMSSNEAEQAAFQALSLWLQGADLTNNFGSILPLAFFTILCDYQELLMSLEGSQIYCHECRQIVAKISKRRATLPPGKIFDRCGYEGYCPQGHLLYKGEGSKPGSTVNLELPSHYNEGELSIPAFLRKAEVDRKN